MHTILQQGRNCWRLVHAKRVALLMDGEAYFAALRAALEQAKKTIFIIGWDIDSRMFLTRDNVRESPVQLSEFLDASVRHRPGLHAYVLTWDFAALYTLERESFPRYKWQWRTHRRFHFHMDDSHPLGGCHHQKIVVIDDAVAFVGGFDLTKCRWDTQEHRADESRRIDPDGNFYAPFHDFQMTVDGAAAAALGDLARTRWQRATGKKLHLPPRIDHDPWPFYLNPDMENTQVAIARTEPAHANNPAVREVEQLYLDAIAAAQHSIYIESQYLTSATIGQALADRLRAANGPEILIVVPQQTHGWLEQATMDVLRARLLHKLRAADRYNRLRVCYPIVPGLVHDCINVHAKLLIIDDKLVRIGSANLSNRSMGLDTECDLAIEAAQSQRIRQAIAAFRNRLLAHHLGVSPERVAQALVRNDSLLTAAASLRHGDRTLRELDGRVSEVLDKTIPNAAIIDPERPLDPETLLAQWLPGYAGGAKNATRPLAKTRRLVHDGVLVTLGITLRLTPLERWLDAAFAKTHQWLRESLPRSSDS